MLGIIFALDSMIFYEILRDCVTFSIARNHAEKLFLGFFELGLIFL